MNVREVKKKLYRYMKHNKTKRYVDVLSDVEESHNNRKVKAEFLCNINQIDNAFKVLFSSILLQAILPLKWALAKPVKCSNVCGLTSITGKDGFPFATNTNWGTRCGFP